MATRSRQRPTTRQQRRRRSTHATPTALIIAAAALSMGVFIYLIYGRSGAAEPLIPDLQVAGQINGAAEATVVDDDHAPATAAGASRKTAPPRTALPPSPPSASTAVREQIPTVAEATPQAGPFDIESGSFQVETRVPGNEQATCHWVRPRNGAAPRAQDVVVYLHYPDEREFFRDDGRIPSTRNFIRLAREGGFTVMGIWFDGQSASTFDHFASANRSRSYVHPESGSADALVEAHRRLRELCALPDAPVLAFGLSGGGIAGQLLSEYRPDFLDALASHGATEFIQYGRKRTSSSRTAFLFVYTAGDDCSELNLAAAAYYRRQGHAVADLETPMRWASRGHAGSLPHHVANQATIDLMLRYLEGASDVRRANHGIMPGAAAWPGQPAAATWPPCASVTAALRRFPPAPRESGDGLVRASAATTSDRLVVVRRGVWSDSPLPDKPDADPEWDLRQYADLGFDAVFVRGTRLPQDLLRGSHTKVFLDVQDPGPAEISSVLAEPRVTGIAITCTALRPGSDLAGDVALLLAAGKTVTVTAAGGDVAANQAIIAQARVGRVRFGDQRPNVIAPFTCDELTPGGDNGIAEQRCLATRIAAFSKR